MKREDHLLQGVKLRVYAGEARIRTVLLQPMDESGLEEADREAEEIFRAGGEDILLALFQVNAWQDDLSPWSAPPAFGRIPFGGGAARTLAWMEETLLPWLRDRYPWEEGTPLILGGYSLAGLFALWCGHSSDAFDGIAAASPSVWFPGWMDFAQSHPLRARAVYLSLGDREEKTRNPLMAQVGDCIRRLYGLYRASAQTALEWNPGNHFQDAGLRTAKAFLWAAARAEKKE